MKKIVFSLMAICLFSGPMAYAQQQVTTVSTQQPAPVAMYIPPANDPLQVSIQGGGLWAQKNEDRLRDGVEVLGRITYDLTPNVALGGESGGIRFKDEMNGVKFGYLDGIPILADLVLKAPIAATGNRLVPYVFGGIGVIIWQYNKSSYSDSTGLDARDRTHFAAQPGAGVEYYLTPHIALFLEGSYLFSEKFTLNNGSATPPNGKLDVNSIYGAGGIKIAF